MELDRTTITVPTDAHESLVKLTADIQDAVSDADVSQGLCTIKTHHTTAGIFVNEDESNLKGDIIDHLDRLFPQDATYEHNNRGPDHDENGAAHLKTITIGDGTTIPVEDNDLLLGTYQELFLAEMDGPRDRDVDVVLLGF